MTTREQHIKNVEILRHMKRTEEASQNIKKARATKSHSEMHDTATSSMNVRVLAGLASNESIPDSAQSVLLDRAYNKRNAKDAGKNGVEDRFHLVHIGLAMNPSVSESSKRRIAYGDSSVAKKILINRDNGSELQHIFANDNDDDVRLTLTEIPLVLSSVRARLLNDPSPKVKNSMVKRVLEENRSSIALRNWDGTIKAPASPD